MKYLCVIILSCLSSYAEASSDSRVDLLPKTKCIEATASLKGLVEGSYIDIPVGDSKVVVYKRTALEIAQAKDHKESKFDSTIPGWWPKDKHPTFQEVERKNTRSLHDELFVFWGFSPVYGYSLLYIPEGASGDFYGKPWKGGFVDVVNMISYDATGRPVKVSIPEDRKSKVGNLSNSNLLVPLYILDDKLSKISILCEI